MAPHGIRCNVIQAGVTDTQALQAIPGSGFLKGVRAAAEPVRTADDPARRREHDLPALARRGGLGEREIIRVDGGEHVSGLTS